MGPSQYEELVSRLAQAISSGIPDLKGGTIGFGWPNIEEGASGYSHHIDVSVEADRILLIVECKCWGRHVDTVATLAFSARLIDIRDRYRNQKEVVAALATVKGFDPGAELLAKYFGVELWHVRDEHEFAGRVREVVFRGLVDTAGLSDSAKLERRDKDDNVVPNS